MRVASYSVPSSLTCELGYASAGLGLRTRKTDRATISAATCVSELPIDTASRRRFGPRA
jgi:hypothetical protein